MEILPQHNYDKSSTIFSPEGKIPQIEYAREAIKRGSTAIGIKTIDGIVLLSIRQIPTKLIKTNSIEKIYRIDNHIMAATVGMTADGRALIEKARIEAQINMATYDEPIGIETLTKKTCDYIYLYTQSGGFRPFGASLLIAGIENGKPRLFETDPSGAFFEYDAIGIGGLRQDVINMLEEKYTENLTNETAIELGKKILNELNITNIEITTLTLNGEYHKYN